MGPDVAKKRGDESKNYFPPIPPTRIPFLLIPDFCVSFVDLPVLWFFISVCAFLCPLLGGVDRPTTTAHNGCPGWGAQNGVPTMAVHNGCPLGPGPHGAQRRPLGGQKKGPKKGDHIHWWTINEFIDGNPLIFIDGNPLIFIDGVQQWISMDFQFFEIQLFEKTMKRQWINNKKQRL